MKKMNNNDSPLVSVVMAVYNGGKHLEPAVASILSQTYTNFEFIVINDGSTDDTQKTIEGFNDPRIIIVNQKNHGLVYSLNKGIQMARGEYIARMDADDISLPSRFEKEVEWLSRDPKRGMVSTYFSLIDFEDGRPIGETMTFPIHHADLRRSLYVTNPFPHGATMYRKSVVESLGMYDKNDISTEDYGLWVKLSKDWEVGLIPESLYWYRINNPDSISKLTSNTQEDNVVRIRHEQWSQPFLKKNWLSLWKDYHDIKYEVPQSYRRMVEYIYKSQQHLLAKELLLHHKYIYGLHQLIGATFIYPRGMLKLIYFLPQSIYKRIVRKLRGNKK
ncbi:glycosyltransferase [Candidatus Saccharibacteria bacterium]|nr:glycosyltransferase [Candidatus Saccharibacteria bacterium]